MYWLYADGASSKNGAGGWAWTLVNERGTGELDQGSGFVADATNQRMELTAAICGLLAVPEEYDLTVISDSAYLINCFNDAWYIKWRILNWHNSSGDPVSNRDLWEDLLETVDLRRGQTLWKHVRGHRGDRWNEYTDRLAVAAKLTGMG